ncbi:MAG: phenylacetate--CoA ligase [Paludibacteraceae bacterium]|nr:phenylacetate--CoA ligase [Paludibacteraceae bacterium]MBP5482434.1 phenylacetate--CoA ligase [Paludibacteraceae bacterium]
MIWNETVECMDRQRLRDLQSVRLKRVVERVYHNCEPYRKRMQEAGVSPSDINGIEDIAKLPFTSKQDLRDYYPYGLLSSPLSEIVRIHASSGTTGKPIVVGLTRNDLSVWSEVGARCLTAFGLGKNDTVQVAYGYGLFTGGLGAHAAVENIGGTVIPISSGNTQKQILMMRDLGAKALACTPSYAMYLAEAMEASGYPREDFQLRVGVFGAEPWTEEMRRTIEAKLNIKAYDIYGLTEIMGPGVGYECECQHGTHLNEDHFFPEIVDPETGEPLPEGSHGELVFTTLTKEGMPLIRFRTHDLTALHYEKCKCGRTLVRMDKIMGRCDDMLIIRGVNVFPSQIESVLCEAEEFEPHFFITVDRVNNTDTFEVKVEVKPEYYKDDMKGMLELKKSITHKIQNVIGIMPDVKLVEPRSIERSEGKVKRVLDKRVFKN